MLKNLLWVTGGNLVFGLAQWYVIFVIARLGTLEMQGQFSFCLALIAPVTMFFRMNLRGVLATDHGNEFDYSDYFTCRLLFSATSSLALVSIYFVYAGVGEAWSLFALVCLYKFVEGLSDITYGKLQKENDLKAISISLLMRSLVLVFAFALALLLFDSIVAGAFVVALFWFAIFIYFDVGTLKSNSISRFRYTSSISTALALGRQCLPLGATMGAISAFTFVPVYVLKLSYSLADIGRYTAVSYFWVMGTFVLTALMQTYAAPIAKLFHTDTRRYIIVLTKFTCVVMVVGSILLLLIAPFSDQIVVAMYGDEYGNLGILLIIILSGVLLNVPVSILGLNMTISRRFLPMLVINLVSLSAIICAALIIVPSKGVIGAGLSLLVGVAIKLLISSMVNLHLIHDRVKSI
jgi:O-antigen/teichoic acid export membrane protein